MPDSFPLNTAVLTKGFDGVSSALWSGTSDVTGFPNLRTDDDTCELRVFYPARKCAPVSDTIIDLTDDRVAATKDASNRLSPWAGTVNGEVVVRRRRKRDAIAAAARWVAIDDWWARFDAQQLAAAAVVTRTLNPPHLDCFGTAFDDLCVACDPSLIAAHVAELDATALELRETAAIERDRLERYPYGTADEAWADVEEAEAEATGLEQIAACYRPLL